MIIYKSTNKINGKCYIGQTIRDLNYRRTQHLNKDDSCPYFHRAISKYGQENFKWEVLCECETKEKLDEMECYHIKENNSFGDGGYNLTYGGSENQFTKLNKKDRSKIHFLNKMLDDEREKYLDEKYRGDNHYTKRLMTEDERQFWLDEYKIGENNPMYGKNHSIEARNKISKAKLGKKGNPCTEETKEKISNANSGSKNGMAKKYKITKPNGEIEMIKGLSQYCRDNNISAWNLKKYNKVESIN